MYDFAKKISKYFLISIIVLLLMEMGLYFLIKNVYSPETAINWTYTQAKSETELESAIPAAAFKKSGKLILTPKFEYYKFHAAFSSDDNKFIKIFTDFNPVKIFINDALVYDKDDFSAAYKSTRSTITLALPDTETQSVTVYYKTDGPLNFSSVLAKTNDITYNSLSFFSLLISAVLFIFGIFLILFYIIIYFMNKKIRPNYSSGLLLICLGLLNFFSIATNYLSPSQIYNLMGLKLDNFLKIETALMMLIIFFTCGVLFSLQNFWKAYQKVIGAFYLLYIVTFLFFDDVFLTRCLYIYFPVLVIFMFIIGLTTLRKVYYKNINFVAFLGTSLLLISSFSAINFIYDFLPFQTIVPILFTITISLVQISALINDTVLKDVMEKERYNQINGISKWVDRILSLNSTIDNVNTTEDFAKSIALIIKSIIKDDISDNSNNSISLNDSLGVSAALSDGGILTEVYTDHPGLKHNYDAIADKILMSNIRNIVIGSTYIDVGFYNNNKIYMIIHVEGIKRGISDNLKNMLKIAYQSIVNSINTHHLKDDMAQTQNSVFINLAKITEEKSQDTAAHIHRVSDYVYYICMEYGMSKEESALISQASLMHDIGKLAISEELIRKNVSLTAAEFNMIKMHVVWGYNILSSAPGELMRAAAIIAQQHHEKWDGSGYLGLEGEQIHKYARIVAIADVFDALTSSRSYKENWSLDEARLFINKNIGIHFEEKTVQAFNNCFYKISEKYKSYSE